MIGVVVSNKMEKSAVVKVTRKKQHPLYKKIMTRSKRYIVHSEDKVKIGDRVKIEQIRPYSKNKTWEITKVIKGSD